MKALFGRKIVDLEELKDATRIAKLEGMIGTDYEVTKEVSLSDAEFQVLAGNLLEDQTWIDKEDGGPNEDGALRCIRVINLVTDEKILISSEGYSYCRYSAIEE